MTYFINARIVNNEFEPIDPKLPLGFTECSEEQERDIESIWQDEVDRMVEKRELELTF